MLHGPVNEQRPKSQRHGNGNLKVKMESNTQVVARQHGYACWQGELSCGKKDMSCKL